jgi:hypothetical protein
MRSFACIASASLALLFIGCGQKQDLGGGTGGDGASGSGSGAQAGGGGYDPCAGKTCGDECNVCAPDDADCAETAVVKQCNAAGDCTSEPATCGGTCIYDGNTHQVGDTFQSSNGCNTCECLQDGTVACTDEACQTCGGFQAPEPGVECSDGQYCKMPAGQCGLADGTGVCAPIPMACDLIYDPVCGCDGVTYGNACAADLAQAAIDHDGACDGEFCGGIGGIQCGAGEYCQFAQGTCQVADIDGTCQPQPTACEDILDPVCGCDGKTYGNACEAAAVGMSVDHPGAC